MFSCKNETTNLNAAEKRQAAEARYKKAIFYTQGSTAFQNGIVEALEIDPNYFDAAFNLGAYYFNKGVDKINFKLIFI